jgi:hypothetical protein
MVATRKNMQELLKAGGGLSKFNPSSWVYTDGMLKGSKKAVITKIQPVSIHGQVSLDLYFLDPDDSQGQTSRARVGQESVPRSLEPGDHVELHYVLGVVTHVSKI